MIALFVAADIASTDIVVAQKAALDGYQACVSRNAREFRHSELSGDDPIIMVYAAAYTCNAERANMVEKTKQFLRVRHPGLPVASLGKVTALFIEKEDSRLEQALVSELGKK